MPALKEQDTRPSAESVTDFLRAVPGLADSAGVPAGLPELMRAEEKKPYKLAHFLNDVQALMRIDAQGLGADEKKQRTHPLSSNATRYALVIINDEPPLQEAMRWVLDMAIKSAHQPGIDPAHLQNYTNNFLGKTLELESRSRDTRGIPQADTARWNAGVHSRLQLAPRSTGELITRTPVASRAPTPTRARSGFALAA